ncbi:MAG: aldo/keto reductase [Candidatus Nanopelagicales bacterium]|nr:aldo/keto reductase [Candidatus Nanopelagicales bacterium]
MTLPQRRIGDLQVSSVGIGCMPMSFPVKLENREGMIATIHRALDLGVTFFDTANIYAPSSSTMGHNELLVAEAMRSYTGSANMADVLVTTKGGITRESGGVYGQDSRPEALRAACEKSLKNLGVSQIELYQHHRPDLTIPYIDQMKALLALKNDGLIKRVGISNADDVQINIAIDILGGPADGGLVSVQNQYSPKYRANTVALHRCTELGLAYLPWSPLGGASQHAEVGSRYVDFAEVGVEVNATAQEVALAWLSQLSPVVINIPGATRPETVDSIVRSATVKLSAEQMTRLNNTVPETA